MSNQAFNYSEIKRNLDEIVAQMPEAAMEAGLQAMDMMLLFLLGTLPEYPEASSESLAPDGWSFATDKQRRFFFAAARQGKIKGWGWEDGHPKKISSARTGALGAQMTQNSARVGAVIVGEIGTNLAHAPWVVGPDFPGDGHGYQAKVHAGRWWQLGAVVESNREDAWQEFEGEFIPALAQALKGA